MRLKRIWALAGLGVFIALVAGAYRWPIDSDHVEQDLNSALTPVAGVHWGRPERATLELLPWPMLRIVGAELLDSNGKNVVTAPRAEIALWPQRIVRGEVSPMTARLLNPTALIDLDAARQRAVEMIDRHAALIRRVEMTGGVAHVVSAEHGVDTLIENVDGWISWTKVSRPLSFALNGLWRGEAVAIQGHVEAPLELRKGGPSSTNVRISTPLAEMAFDGVWNTAAETSLDGDVSARTSSLDALERWLGLDSVSPIATQAISLRGKAIGGPGSFSVAGASLDVGGQAIDGSLSFTHAGGRLAASATLAADTLDLTSLWGAPPDPVAADGEWNKQPFPPPPNGALDLDLRLSASRVTWRGHAIEDAAASVSEKDGQLTVRLLEATAYDGALNGEFSARRAPSGGWDAKASASLANADIGAFLTDWGFSAYSGVGSIEANLAAMGASADDFAKSLSGTASITLQDGVVNGVSIEEALRRSQHRPIDVARDLAVGQTRFAQAHARAEIAQGVAQVRDGRMNSLGSIVDASGAIEIAARQWRLRFEALQSSALGEPSVDAAHLTIALFGPWAAPIVTVLPNTN
jgi:AsmA protein